MNWTLLCVLVIIAINSIIGLKKGLIKVLFSLVSLIVVLVITSLFAPKLTAYLKDHTTWDESLASRTETYFEEKGVLKHADGTYEVGELPLPKSLKTEIEKDVNTGVETACDAYNNAVVLSASSMIFKIMVYIGMFIVIYLCLGILEIVLNIVSKLPGVRQLNRLGGFAFGLLKGLLIVWIAFMLVTIFNNFDFAAYIYREINENMFLTFLYEKNIIMNIILGFFS